jgi:hypothetical protein
MVVIVYDYSSGQVHEVHPDQVKVTMLLQPQIQIDPPGTQQTKKPFSYSHSPWESKQDANSCHM